MVCAVKAAQKAGLKEGQRCVVILPDSVRNYMTKALSDDWMLDHGFVDNDIIKAKQYTEWWAQKRVCDLPMSTPLTITSDVSCKEAIALLKKEGYDTLPVLTDGHVDGVVTEGNMTNWILSGRAMPDQSVEDAGVIYKSFHKFSMSDTLSTIANALDHDPYVLIVTEQRCYSGPASRNRKRKYSEDDIGSIPRTVGGGDCHDSETTAPSTATLPPKDQQVETRCVVSGIVTRIDLLDFVSTGKR